MDAIAPQDAPILIVDDDAIIRSLMRASLESDGLGVIEAASGEEARAICASSVPSLLIADVVMPGIDGFELCRLLRARPETAFMPILMATGLDDVSSIMRAYEAGATDFIVKPINWLLLNHRVRYILRAGRAFDELRQNQDRLIAAKDAAVAASRAKSEFLANMSHELRTPLNAIIGFSSIMRDAMFGPLDPKYAEFSALIADSGNHLLAIINSILDIAKAESNQLLLKEETVDLARIAGFSMSLVGDMAKKAEIDCRASIAPNLPPFFADSPKLSQILINLLSNAVKFTPPGGRVRLTIERHGDGDLAFRIEDSGIGMSADKLPLALSPFGQIDSGLARKYEGIGLGLPLTKRLIELHDGTMTIDSEAGKGTVVTARFPAARFRPVDAASSLVRRIAG